MPLSIDAMAILRMFKDCGMTTEGDALSPRSYAIVCDNPESSVQELIDAGLAAIGANASLNLKGEGARLVKAM